MWRKVVCIVFLLSLLAKEGESYVYCYRCNSNSPGCGDDLNWLYWSEACPEYDDKCVKVIERKGAETIITRDCLSSLRGFRTDMPADRYEGCRAGAKDVRLGHYVNNSIHELDIRRDYYDETTWCFCYFHHRCNGASGLTLSTILLSAAAIFWYFTT